MTARIALTVWAPWSSLIAAGLKPVEFRTWAYGQRFVGQRVVIHAGMRSPVKAIRHLLASDDNIRGSCGPGCDVAKVRAALERWASEPGLLPRGAGIGEATLGEAAPANVHYERIGLAIGGEGPWRVAWPMLDVEAWDEPVPARGAQGFWGWRP